MSPPTAETTTAGDAPGAEAEAVKVRARDTVSHVAPSPAAPHARHTKGASTHKPRHTSTHHRHFHLFIFFSLRHSEEGTLRERCNAKRTKKKPPREQA